MADERRSARRARLSGVHVTYESAAGERIEGEVRDLGAGGLFICTAAPLAVGKRIALDMHVAGEDGPWAALGRVVWTRPASEGDDKPAGMGVKLIDVDDVVVAAIQRLVETRERTEPGLGSDGADRAPAAPIVAVAAPARERTILGVGLPSAEPPPRPAPEPVRAPEPSAVVPPGAEREKSIAIDLVARKEAPAEAQQQQPAPTEQPATSEPTTAPVRAPRTDPPAAPPASRSEPPEARERTGGGKGWIALLLVAAALVGGYVLWDAGLLPPHSATPATPLPSAAAANTEGARATTAELPTATPTPPPEPMPTAAASTMAAPSATTHASSTPSTKASPSAKTTPSAKTAPSVSGSHRTKKPAAVDNPY